VIKFGLQGVGRHASTVIVRRKDTKIQADIALR
jgi:hypothetical protein